MDDLRDRYAQLVAAFGAEQRTVADLNRLAATLATAAGPPLVRPWLVAVSQTTGLQRLLTERLVPTTLRAEIHDGRD